MRSSMSRSRPLWEVSGPVINGAMFFSIIFDDSDWSNDTSATDSFLTKLAWEDLMTMMYVTLMMEIR